MTDTGDAQIEQIIYAIPIPAVVVDSHLRVRLGNPSFYEAFGVSLSHAGSFFSGAQGHLADIRNVLKSLIADGDPHQRRVVELETHNRTRKTVSLGLCPLRSDEHESLFVVTIQETAPAQPEDPLLDIVERLRIVLDTMPLACVVLDSGFRYVYWNRAAEQIFGYRFENVRGRHPFETIVPPYAQEYVQEIFDRLAEGETKVQGFSKNVTGDGRTIVSSWTNTPFFGPDGRFVGAVSMCQDITERIYSEQILRESEEKFRSLVEQSTDGIVLTDEQGYIIEWNHAQERITGLRRDDVLGRPIWDVQFELSAREEKTTVYYDQLKAVVSKFIENSRPYPMGQLPENRSQHPDGKLRIIQTAIFPIETETSMMIGNIVRDVTENRRVEDELRKLYRAVEQSANAVMITDLEGHIEYVNPKFLEAVGCTADEVIGRELDFLAPLYTPTGSMNAMWDTVRAGREWKGEFYRKGKNSEILWEQVSISPIRDFSGKITHFLLIQEDITELKRIEEALRDSERFARSTVDALAAHIAILDETGTIIAVNNAWRAFYYANSLAKDANAFEGMNYLSVCDQVTGEDRDYAHAIADGIRAVMAGQKDDFTLEYTCHSPYEQRWFVARVTRFPDDGPIRIVVAHENITNRKRAENELSALYNATSYLLKANSPPNLGHQIVQAVTQEFNKVDCGLMLVDKAQGKMVRLARVGKHAVNPTRTLYLDQPGLVSEAVRTGKVVYVPDVRAAPNYLPNDLSTQSELVIPLITSRGVIGVLDLQSAQLDAFNERDQRILSAFAERAASAIEIMQLYEELNQRTVDLEWRVAQRTAEFQRVKDRVEAILNSSSDAIILSHIDGSIEQVNLAFNQLFGYELDDVFRQSLTMLLDTGEEKRLQEMLSEVASAGQPGRLELVCRRKDQTAFTADVAFAPIVGTEAQTRSVICSIRDITERKRAEEELRAMLAKEKEVSELKSRFVSMVSHEFRTPLTTILSSSSILRDYGSKLSDEKKLSHFNKIHAQVRRLTDLLEDVLTIGRAQTVGIEVKPEPVNVEALCRTFAEEMSQLSDRHQIKFAVAGSCAQAHIDAKLVGQAITNLLTNAIKYSPNGGPIYFDLACGEHDFTLRVRDEGIGIPEEDQHRLFETFHRAHNVGTIKGSGLGLAIVKHAVEAHNGTISVESKLGAGTTFTITIPFKTDSQG